MNSEIPHVPEKELLLLDRFTLECSICCKDVEVTSLTQSFREVGRGPMLAYYSPPREAGHSTLAGVSDGVATNFECLSCHSKRWIMEERRKR